MKKLLVLYALLISTVCCGQELEGNCVPLLDRLLCGKHLLFVEVLNSNTSQSSEELLFDLNLSSYSSLNGPATVLKTITVNLLDQNYFTLLGGIQLGSSPSAIWNVYSVDANYPGIIPGNYYTLDVQCQNPYWYSPHLFYLSGKTKLCGECITCYNTLYVNTLFDYIYTEFLGRHFLGVGAPTVVPPVSYTSLTAIQKGYVRNVFIPFLVSESQFSNYESNVASIGNPELVVGECLENRNSLFNCACLKTINDFFKHEVLQSLEVNWSTKSNLIALLSEYVDQKCGCLSSYCFFVEESTNSYKIHGIPIGDNYNPLLAIQIVNIGNKIEMGIGFRYGLSGIMYSTNWSFSTIPSNAINWDTSVKEFLMGSDFLILDKTYFKENCDLPCENCISSFSPLAGNFYVVSAWVRNTDFAGNSSVVDAKLKVNLKEATGVINTLTFMPEGSLIDGWGRINKEFYIPANTEEISLVLETSGIPVFFDDIRVYPKDGQMKSYVFDPVNLRLVAELDENHYATFYEYDEEGKLIRQKKETERGIMTIKEVRESLQKKNNP